MNQYDKKKLLNYIDTVSFALIDTTLYLDTHPNDQKAINHFNQYQKARKQALKEYARNFEPLTIDSAERKEWKSDKNVLKNQVKYGRKKKVDGFAFFDYQDLTSKSSSKAVSQLKTVLKKQKNPRGA